MSIRYQLFTVGHVTAIIMVGRRRQRRPPFTLPRPRNRRRRRRRHVLTIR